MIEQVGGIAEYAFQMPRLVLLRIQRQIHLGRIGGALDLLQRQAGQLPQRAQIPALMVDHDLEQRVMREAALGLQGLDQLLEGQFLMRLRLQHGLAHLPQQCGKRERAVDLRAQHLRVDEKADHAFGLDAVAVGDGHAHAQIALAGVAVEQDLEGRQEHGEERGVGLSGRGAQLVGQWQFQ
ncbi:hypothetical protein LMG21510_05093 [Cupriavidus respiraculi]|uniref:Uncharacterized protein n=1 Tax=Cupriavidus respiraculi TaxID=195930 RepID=A0ABM8XW28_9BURK|nr:hypothetical protein LMG21510_05093 [Cupriavidus respiraculi]